MWRHVRPITNAFQVFALVVVIPQCDTQILLIIQIVTVSLAALNILQKRDAILSWCC